MIAISLQGATKHFPRTGRISLRALLAGLSEADRFTAVDQVSLRVPQGEVMGVLGRNGAGKSTLLRLAGGIYSPDEGSIWLGGDVAGMYELGGFGNTQLTGREFAVRYLQLFGVPRSRWAEVVEEVRDFSELANYFDEPIRTYSAGMAARLYFSVATAIPHEIYLIDEILSVGDEHFQAKSWARMRERLAGGASGLLVTHDWSAVIKLCRTSKVLDRGRVAIEGRSDAVVAAYLDLPRLAGTRAQIIDPSPEALVGVSGEDGTIRFDVHIAEPIRVQAAVSIEVLQLGVGWEPVVLTEFADVAGQPGLYTVSLHIPALPLRPGEYSLNLFISGAPDPDTGVRESLDARAWTYGNGLVFTITGPAAGQGVAPFPVRWAEEPSEDGT